MRACALVRAYFNKEGAIMMKKKLLVMLVVLTFIVTLVVCAACDGTTGMFIKNEERNMTQVTAKVNYAGRKSEVNKIALNETVNQFVYQQYVYYSYGYISATQYAAVLSNIGKSFDQANESLAKSEIYTLKCIDELYKNIIASGTAEQKAAAQAASTVGKAYDVNARIKEIESILPEKYLKAARKTYNEDMKEAFDNYREEYEKEIEASNKTTKSLIGIEEIIIDSEPGVKVYEVGDAALNLNGLKVSVKYEDKNDTVSLERSEYTVTGFDSAEAVDGQEITVTFGGKTATFTVDIKKAPVSRPVMPKDEEDDDDGELEELFEKTMAEDIKKAKEDGKVDEWKALKEAKRRLEKQMNTNYRSYDYYYLVQLKSQAVTAYEDTLSDAVTVSNDDITAKYNELLASQKEALIVGTGKYKDIANGSGINTQIIHEQNGEGYFYVQNILFKLTDDLTKEYDEFDKMGTANEEALAEYKRLLCDKIGVWVSNVEYDKDAKCEEEECNCVQCSNYKGDAPGICTDINCECKACRAHRFINDEFAATNSLTKAADGSLNVWDVINVAKAEIDAAANAKDKLETFRKWAYMCNEDDGAFSAYKDGKMGYMLGKESSDYVESFTALSRALAGYTTETSGEGWSSVGTGVGAYGYCYTTYGIHLVMLTGYACDSSATDMGDGYSQTAINTITNIWEYKTGAEEDDKAGTLRDYLYDMILEEKKSDATGTFKMNVYNNEMKGNYTLEKNYGDLVDAYGKNN